MRHPHGLRAAAGSSGGGVDIAVSHLGSSVVNVYPWLPGFGAKYSDPATLPGANGRSVAFSPSGTDIAVSYDVSPYVSVYPWSSGFGTKYADPATLPNSIGLGTTFLPAS